MKEFTLAAMMEILPKPFLQFALLQHKKPPYPKEEQTTHKVSKQAK